MDKFNLTKLFSDFKYRFVSILWLDAKSHSEWVGIDLAADESGAYCLSVGMLINENDDIITLATDFSFENGEVESYGGTINIPVGCIIEIKEYHLDKINLGGH